MVFYTLMIHILAFCLDFEVAKTIHVFQLLIQGFGGHWRLLTGVWYVDPDLDKVTGLWYTHMPNFGSRS